MPGRDFDLLKSLEVFVTVAETGSMTVAASRLRLTQSAISQQIKLLETDFGASLFFREMRPLRLTPAGITLSSRAENLLLGAKRMRADVRHAASGSLPHLRVALLSTFAKYLVPAILEAKTDLFLPVDNITIARGMTANHAQDLANREIDAAFTSDAFDAMPGLEQVELVRESYLLVTPRRWTFGDEMRSIAAQAPFLRFSTRTQTGQKIESHLRRLRIEPARGPTFESSSDLVAAVHRGYGWSILTPSQLLDPLASNPAIALHPLPKPGLSRAVGLVWRSGELALAMQRLNVVCARALRTEFLPRLCAVAPAFQDHFNILPDLVQGEA